MFRGLDRVKLRIMPLKGREMQLKIKQKQKNDSKENNNTHGPSSPPASNDDEPNGSQPNVTDATNDALTVATLSSYSIRRSLISIDATISSTSAIATITTIAISSSTVAITDDEPNVDANDDANDDGSAHAAARSDAVATS